MHTNNTTVKFKIPAATREAFTDISAYPILTEEVGYPSSPAATASGMYGGTAGTSGIGQMAANAVAAVLGWKPKAGDTKGFLGALTQSFSVTDVEGRIEAKWTPRTYAVQTDLSGGITGAQATIYARAQQALDQAGPLIDGLYPLRVDASPEDIQALKAIVNSQMRELVGELGVLGGPRVSRVNQYFQLLLGPAFTGSGPTETEPDKITGTLGTLRDELGLWSVFAPSGGVFPPGNKPLINTVEDEQDVTNFRLIVDYVTSLALSWINNKQFFGLSSMTPFFGTQLVILSRQLSVVADAVDEVRFTMDSVFIPASERQTLEIDFPKFVALAKHPPARLHAITAIDHTHQIPAPALGSLNDNQVNSQNMFVEDVLSWVQAFASDEGPRLIQEGGKFAVSNSVLPIVTKLRNLVLGTMNAQNRGDLPKGFSTQRVQRALGDLASQLDELAFLANPVSYTIPSQK